MELDFKDLKTRIFNTANVALLVICTAVSEPGLATGNSWWNTGFKWWNTSSNSVCISSDSNTEQWQWTAGQNQLTLNGDAVETSEQILLTQGLHQASAVFWNTPLPLYTESSEARSFSAAFSFKISDPDGIADKDGQGWDIERAFKFFTINGSPTSFLVNCMRSTNDKTVTVTLPNDDVEAFTAWLDGLTGSQVADNDPDCNLTASTRFDLSFEPKDGTTSTLEAYANQNMFRNGDGDLLADIADAAPASVTKYRLTTKSGFVYNLDQNFGIETVSDPNGNTLNYSSSGITHSAGKSIVFNRDSEGRITSITDPMGKQINYSYSTQGDLDSSTDRAGNTSTYQYDNIHGLTDLFDPLGRRLLKNFYDSNGRLVAQEDNEGNRTNFLHNLTGRTSQVTDRLGRITQFAYDARGNVASEVDALGNLTSYTHDANDNQLSQTDALSHVTEATYDEDDNQLTQTDELGRVTGFTYNQFGKEVIITDPKGNAYANSYDSVGNLISISDSDGNLLGVNLINNQGLVTQLADTFDNFTRFTYDGNGNKLTQTDALGNVTTMTYDVNGNVLTETVQRTVGGVLTDETTTYQYDALDRLIQTTDALGNINTMAYDAVGNKVQDTDALNRITTYTYDAYRRLTRTDYPDGSAITMGHDAEGNLTSETDANGNTTGYQYDALNRLTQTTYADGSTSQSAYDAIGRVTSETDERGNVNSYQYDAAGQRTQVTDALSNITRFTYDANGNLETMTDARGNAMQYAYDVYDNRTVTTWADSSTSSEVTDRKGRKTSQTDQNGNTINYAYDALDRLISVTDALNNITSYSYDEVGNKLTQTDAEGRTTSWAYDALGRVLMRTLPLGQVETMRYDAVGNLTQTTDFNGQVTTYTYDSRDRLVTTTYNDASTETNTYDNHGNRLTATDRLSRNQSWMFDSRHRLTQVIDASNNQISYVYDATGNKTQQTTTPNNTGSAQITNYGYDILNRLQSVTDSNAQITNYSYDANGNRATVGYPNGNTTSYVYDVNNRLTQQSTQDNSNTVIADYQYTLDPSGHRTKIVEPNRTTDYTYDNSYKLFTEVIVDAINGNHNASYSYDTVGNRTGSTINGVQTVYTVDDNDRLTQQGGEVLTYDNNGNTLTKTIDGFQTTYSYDAKNLLSTAQINNAGTITASSYQYDIDGIRIQKTEDSATTDYLIDHNRDYAQVVRETDGTGVSIDYLYGDDLIQQSENAANERYYVYDGLGSTRALTDNLGTITDSYDYEAFGSTLNQTGATDNNYRFTGEQYDSALDNYYLRARYYDPNSARFTQMDTWRGVDTSPSSLNKYAYTEGDPINNTDPSGRFLAGLSVGISGRGIMAAMAVASLSAIIGNNMEESEILGSVSNGQGRRLNLWDVVAMSKFRGAVSAGTQSQTTTGARTRRSDDGHHTIPIYLCGSQSQQLARIDRRQHAVIHSGIAALEIALNTAEDAADRMVPFGRRRNNDVMSLAESRDGRAAISGVLQTFYQGAQLWSEGTPSIGTVFPNERRQFINGKTSLPLCKRGG